MYRRHSKDYARPVKILQFRAKASLIDRSEMVYIFHCFRIVIQGVTRGPLALPSANFSTTKLALALKHQSTHHPPLINVQHLQPG